MLDKKAYTEVFYIINEMSEEMRSKIPDKILKNIQARMDKEYKFYVDEDNIENIELLDDTEKILSVLYTDYFATYEERKIILNKEKIIKNAKNNKTLELHEIFPNNENNFTEEQKSKEIRKDIKIIKFLKKIFN